LSDYFWVSRCTLLFFIFVIIVAELQGGNQREKKAAII